VRSPRARQRFQDEADPLASGENRPLAPAGIYFGADPEAHPWAASCVSLSPSILCCDHRGEGLQAALGNTAARGWSARVSTDLRSTRSQIEASRPDVIVLDPLAESGTAEIEAVEHLRARDGELEIPILLVTEAGDARRAVAAARAFENGAFDLVHRGASPEEFAFRIERLLAHARHAQEVAELRYRALHDDRTDLLRAAAFEQRLAEHFSAAERHRLPMALVLIDLDQFGRINKDHDHTVGDQVIARVGAAIRAALRAEDVAGRLGGDEFAVLLPYTARIDAAHAVRRLRDRIRELAVDVSAGGSVEVHASLGFETFDGSDLTSLSDLRRHAEVALRAAKQRGGDRGIYFRTLRPPAES